jgi:WD40 repeat protein
MSQNDHQHSALCESVNDSHRFLLNFFDMIQTSVAQLYHSALPHTPKTPLWDIYHARELQVDARVLQGRETRWNSLVRTIEAPDRALAVRYSHNGSMLAVGGRDFSYLVRSGAGERLADLESRCGDVRSVSFSCDDRILATASNSTVRIWNIDTGSHIVTLHGDGRDLLSVDFHPSISHLLVAGDEKGRIYVWDVRGTGDSQTTLDVVDGQGILCWIQQHLEKRVLIGCSDGRTEIWDIDTSQRVRVFSPLSPDAMVCSVASSNDGSLVASGSYIGTVMVYNSHTGDVFHSFKYSQGILSLAFSPAAHILAFGPYAHNLYFFFYEDHTSDRVISLAGHHDWIHSVAFSPNGGFITSASSDRTIRVWETEATEPAQDDEHHLQQINRTHFSNDGRLAISVSDDKMVKVWDTRTGALCTTLKGHMKTAWDAIILFDDTRVLSADWDGNFILWDWRQEKILCRNMGMTKEYGSFRFIFPYTSSPRIFDFISTYSLSYNSQERTVCCWGIDASETDNASVVLVARGIVHTATSNILRITYRDSTDITGVTIVLECDSGRQYTAFLQSSIVLSDPPQELHFVEEAEQSLLKGTRQPLTASEGPCFQSKDEAWILDEHGRQIFWVPPANRGHGRWHERRLVIAGKSGRLTIVDFSDVVFDEDALF